MTTPVIPAAAPTAPTAGRGTAAGKSAAATGDDFDAALAAAVDGSTASTGREPGESADGDPAEAETPTVLAGLPMIGTGAAQLATLAAVAVAPLAAATTTVAGGPATDAPAPAFAAGGTGPATIPAVGAAPATLGTPTTPAGPDLPAPGTAGAGVPGPGVPTQTGPATAAAEFAVPTAAQPGTATPGVGTPATGATAKPAADPQTTQATQTTPMTSTIAAAAAPTTDTATGVEAPAAAPTAGASAAAPQPTVPAAAATAAPPTQPAAPVNAPQAAAPAAPSTPAPPAHQVAMHLTPLKLDADGIHRLTVQLHPADLGPVNVVAEIRDGTIAVQLVGGTEAGRETLRAALPDLRRELTEAGFTDCQLDLRSGTGQGDGPQQFAGPPGWTGDEPGTPQPESITDSRQPTVLSGGRVDVQV